MQLGRQRTELERDLEDLGHRVRELAARIEAAADAHRANEVNDLTWEMADVEKKLDETSFLLSLLQETAA